MIDTMKRIFHILILAAALPLLTRCGIYGTYSRGDIDVPFDSLYTDSLPADTSLAAIPWREFFTDPLLQQLIATALERNTDLAVARLQVDQAQAALTNARLQYLPSLDFNAQGATSHFNGNTSNTYSAGISAQWEADVFGSITTAKRGSAEALRAQVYYVQAVRTQLIATVAESYFTLLMLDRQLEIARATVANWDQTIVTLQALVAAGRATDVAVLQAQANRTALQASIVQLTRSVADTESALCTLLKQPVQPIPRSTLAAQSFPERLTLGVPLDLLANRPDVQQAEAELTQAFYHTNNARAAFFPRLTIGGTLGFTNSSGAIVNPGQWLTSAIAQLTAPLFNRGTNQANLAIAQARQQQAALLFEQSIYNAAQQVNDALTAWQTANQLIDLDHSQIADLTTAVEHSDLLMRYTSATYLEVLTAQQALLSAQLTLANHQQDKFSAIITLYHALGGGRF